MLNYLKNILKPKPLSNRDRCRKQIKKLGYVESRKDSDSFHKRSNYGDNIISLINGGILFKIYFGNGPYTESEFLPSPLPDNNKLIHFINSNEI
jgi:hypothetical protein